MDARCAGWETGKCPGPQADAEVERACEACGEVMKASSEALLDEVMEAHAPPCKAALPSPAEDAKADEGKASKS